MLVGKVETNNGVVRYGVEQMKELVKKDAEKQSGHLVRSIELLRGGGWNGGNFAMDVEFSDCPRDWRLRIAKAIALAVPAGTLVYGYASEILPLVVRGNHYAPPVPLLEDLSDLVRASRSQILEAGCCALSYLDAEGSAEYVVLMHHGGDFSPYASVYELAEKKLSAIGEHVSYPKTARNNRHDGLYYRPDTWAQMERNRAQAEAEVLGAANQRNDTNGVFVLGSTRRGSLAFSSVMRTLGKQVLNSQPGFSLGVGLEHMWCVPAENLTVSPEVTARYNGAIFNGAPVPPPEPGSARFPHLTGVPILDSMSAAMLRVGAVEGNEGKTVELQFTMREDGEFYSPDGTPMSEFIAKISAGGQARKAESSQSGNRIDVPVLAARYGLAARGNGPTVEYHGRNPWEDGAAHDGFWINHLGPYQGTAFDRKLQKAYSRLDVARLSGILPGDYIPCHVAREVK